MIINDIEQQLWQLIKQNKRMSCKFKQIVNIENTTNFHQSVNVANSAVCALIEQVGAHMIDKKAQEKRGDFLKTRMFNLSVNTFRQVYLNSPHVPGHFAEEQSPRVCNKQSHRPMSAQIRYQSSKSIIKNPTIQSKNTIVSHSSKFGRSQYKRPATASSSITQAPGARKRHYQRKSYTTEKKFFAIKTSFDNQDSFIDQLRTRKVQQQQEIRKKQQFLKSIQFQTKNFSQSQSKFMQTMSRKKFIYGQHGEVIQIGKSVGVTHLKKVSTMGKSRVQIKEKPPGEMKKIEQQAKLNIYVEFKGRQGFDSRPQTAKPVANAQTKPQSQSLKLQTSSHLPQKPKTSNYLIEVKPPKQQNYQKNIPKPPNSPLHSVSSLQTDGDIMSQKEQVKLQEKKAPQKIYFYASVNSVYRVIDDSFKATRRDNQEHVSGNNSFLQFRV